MRYVPLPFSYPFSVLRIWGEESFYIVKRCCDCQGWWWGDSLLNGSNPSSTKSTTKPDSNFTSNFPLPIPIFVPIVYKIKPKVTGDRKTESYITVSIKWSISVFWGGVRLNRWSDFWSADMFLKWRFWVMSFISYSWSTDIEWRFDSRLRKVRSVVNEFSSEKWVRRPKRAFLSGMMNLLMDLLRISCSVWAGHPNSLKIGQHPRNRTFFDFCTRRLTICLTLGSAQSSWLVHSTLVMWPEILNWPNVI